MAELLNDERVTVELIADGTHLDPQLIRFIISAIGTQRVCAVTDAMAAAGAPDGLYLIGALDVEVRDGVARRAEGHALAGSTLTMDRALRVLVQDCGVDLADAARIVSTNPARVLGVPDIGRLARGYRADLVALDDDLEVEAVMRRGGWARG